MIIKLLSLVWLCKSVCTFDSSIQGFDDSVLYSINWVGPLPKHPFKIDNSVNFDELFVQTEANEKYMCLIPKAIEREKFVNDKYTGPSSVDLLNEIATLSSCSYWLEPFWTYELCHGRYIRQYHEEREGKKVKLQEYFIGKWDSILQHKLKEALELEETQKVSQPARVKKIDGMNIPYIQLNMSEGTFCELSNKERVTNVLYVCYALGKHEIYSLKETSTCEYEAIVLSPLLCVHPRYRPQASGENSIVCSATEDSGSAKPKSLEQLEAESVKLRQQTMTDELENILAVLFDNAPGEAGIPRVRLELLSVNDENGVQLDVGGGRTAEDPFGASIDSNDYNNFIAGRDCVQGGSGWWKYEFCYGKSITQYHIAKDGSKKSLSLGKFIKAGHLKWLQANPHKRPIIGQQLSYLYTMGSTCEGTGRPRQTEVKLKCVEGGGSAGAVSLYLLEPKVCEYVLGVESHLNCRLIQQVDGDGFLVHEDFVGFNRANYNNDYKEPTKTPPVKGPDTKSNNNKRDIKITVVLPDEGNHIADGDE